LEQLFLSGSDIYGIEYCSFCGQHSLKILDLSNTHIFSLTSGVLLGLSSLETLQFRGTVVRYVSESILQMTTLKTFETDDIHFCCLKSHDKVPLCANVDYSTLRTICSMSNPGYSFLFLPYLMLPFVLNAWTAVYVFSEKKKLRGSSFFYVLCWGLVMSVTVTAYHILIENTTKDDKIQFYLQQTNAAVCKFIGYSTYFSSIFYPCIIIMHWLDVFFAIKFAVHKDKRLRRYHRFGILVLLIAIITGGGTQLAKNGSQDTVCEIKLDLLGKIILLAFQGVIYLVLCLSMIAVMYQMQKIRKAADREMGRSEKAVRMRFYLQMLLSALACTAYFLHKTDIIENEVIHLSCRYIHQTILPLTFPILFGLTTRQFLMTMKRFFRCH
jgi:hypothetical protein